MKNWNSIVIDLVLGHDGVWRESQANFEENTQELSKSYQKNEYIEQTQSFEELLRSLTSIVTPFILNKQS